MHLHILTTAHFSQHIEYILGLTSSNNKSMNFFFREKKYMSSSRLRLPQVLWAKMEKNSAINTMYTSAVYE